MTDDDSDSRNLQAELERWLAEKAGAPGGTGEFLHTPHAGVGRDYLRELGFPGEVPFTRGVYPKMYCERLWTMRQYAGFATARQSNRRYRYLLEQGQTGLSVAFDLPTQMGRDSDHPIAAGEVGKVGVAVDSLADFETLFEGIPLDHVSTSMTINATAAILLAMYVLVARRQGVSPDRIRGTLQNDILKEYIARGTYIYPPAPSMRLVADVIEWCAEHAPRFNPISISGYHIREAGSDAAQEIAFTLANGIGYAEAAAARGLSIDRFAPRLSFFFGVHNDFLEEVAKFRAARRLWARITRERLGATDPRSSALRFHTQTCGSTLTAQQPRNNVVRVALQALAAVLGGTQSLHTNAWDEALALPSEESATLALRTQQIVGYESGVTSRIDPLGGSYTLESLTDRLEREARSYLERIDAAGGAVAAVEAGVPQAAIEETAYAYQLAIDRGERVVVGVNRFVSEETDGDAPPLTRVSDEMLEEQVAATRGVRQRRDAGAVERALEALEDAARSERNTMPPIVGAVEALATVGEISDVLRRVFGEYRPG